MRIIKISLYLLSSLLIVSCATKTEYKQASTNFFASKHGFKISPLDTNVYEIKYLGRNKDKHKNIEKLTNRAASELTLEKGFTYFEVVFNQRSENISTHYHNNYGAGYGSRYPSGNSVSVGTRSMSIAPKRLVQIKLSNEPGNNKQHAQSLLKTLLEEDNKD